jgi:hypothetical protein
MNSKLNKVALGSILVAACASVFAASSVFYPKPGGVICDKKGGFCADSQGVSVSITEMELGQKAAKNLMDQINKVGVADFDATTFTMSGGLYCETKQKKCMNKLDKKIDQKATKALFGG